jgi:ABC-type transport system involved in cytochrome c biogenesis ATPase subunit
MYRLTGVTKRYTRGKETVEALRGVDLTIEDGDQLVIQGPTGGGKSTLLQMIGGLDRPTEGSVELDGVDLAKISEARLTRLRAEKIGIIFQSFNLIPTLTAQENVETALVPLGVKPAERRERAADALRSVGLGERLTHAPAELSGQSARVSRSPVGCGRAGDRPQPFGGHAGRIRRVSRPAGASLGGTKGRHDAALSIEVQLHTGDLGEADHPTRGPRKGRSGVHRVRRREAPRLLVRLRHARRLQPVGGPRQRVHGRGCAGDQWRRRA